MADRVVAAEALAAGVTTLTPSYLDDPRYEPLVASIVDRLQSEAATWDHEFPDGNTGEIMGVDDAARVVARWLVRAALIGRTDLDLTAAVEVAARAITERFGELWNAGSPLRFAEAAVRAAAPVIERREAAERRMLAESILVMAAHGGMPGSYWLTDSRIGLACRVLDIATSEAAAYADAKIDQEIAR